MPKREKVSRRSVQDRNAVLFLLKSCISDSGLESVIIGVMSEFAWLMAYEVCDHWISANLWSKINALIL